MISQGMAYAPGAHRSSSAADRRSLSNTSSSRSGSLTSRRMKYSLTPAEYIARSCFSESISGGQGMLLVSSGSEGMN